ncbi:hypothetical protein D3C77_409530 [compost metagenome]
MQAAGAVEQGLGRLVKVGGKAQAAVVCSLQHLGQRRPALLQRGLAQVDAVEVGRIEQVVEDGRVAGAVECVLQGLEVGHAFTVVDHHLAIKPGRLKLQRLECGGLAGQFAGPVVAVAGEQVHLAMVDAGEDAVAVELHLVVPVAVRGGFHQGGQLGLQAVGKGGFFFLGSTGLLRVGRLVRDQGAVAQDAVGLGLQHIVFGFGAGLGVGRLDQQPLLFLAGQVGAKQVPDAGEFLALQAKAQLALGIVLVRVAFGQPHATVPDDDIAGAVVTFGDMAFKACVVQGVVFDMNGQAPHLGVQRRALGDGPAFQGAIELQAKVVVQVAGVVFLDAVLQGAG